jgi:oligopeptide/dipeptide ABC transporter ATP-binding protein
MPPLLRLDSVSIWLPGRSGPAQVVDSVDLHVDSGEIVGVAGESGCGKTVTALSLLQLLPPRSITEGRAMLGSIDLYALKGRQLRDVRGREIAMVFQDPMSSLHPMLTIERQLTEHMRARLNLDERAARARALELLTTVRIPDSEAALGAYPHQLSGGMRQRVAIAMALACRPKVLLADEPTTALDVTVQAGILRLLAELRSREDLSIIFITHDLGVMSSIADRLYVFYGGRVVEAGSTADIISRPRHPYTEALLASRPDRVAPSEELNAIPGMPPHPGRFPDGCVFHPRCAVAISACSTRVPELVTIQDGRALRCPVVEERASATVFASGDRS